MKKRKYSSYLSGGEIGGGLQKAAPGLAAIPGYGWIAALGAYTVGAALKGSDLRKKIYGSAGTPGATPGTYAEPQQNSTGGEINIKPSKRGTFTAAKWHEFGGPLDPIVPPTDSSTYQLTTTPDLGIVPTATPRPAPVYRSVSTGMENMQASQYPYNPIRGVQPVNYNTLMNFKEGSSNKSKSKDRYREKATGGVLASTRYQTGGPIEPNFLSESSNYKHQYSPFVDYYNPPHTMDAAQQIINPSKHIIDKASVNSIASVTQRQKEADKHSKSPRFYSDKLQFLGRKMNPEILDDNIFTSEYYPEYKYSDTNKFKKLVDLDSGYTVVKDTKDELYVRHPKSGDYRKLTQAEYEELTTGHNNTEKPYVYSNSKFYTTGGPIEDLPTINLPEFTVVSARKNSPNYETLKFLGNSEASIPDANYYHVWSKVGKPKIKDNVNLFGREYYSPTHNTMNVRMEEDTYGNMSPGDKAIVERVLYNNNPKGESYESLNPLFFNNATTDFRYRYIEPDSFTSEAAHALQAKKRKGAHMVGRAIGDWVRDPFVSNEGQHRQYSDPRTQEHEAHRVIEPHIKNVLLNTPRRHVIDLPREYQTGGPIKPQWQKLGDIKFDSNKARKGKLGNLIVTDINTGKDYGVFRNRDGSYRFLNDKERPILEGIRNAQEQVANDFVQMANSAKYEPTLVDTLDANTGTYYKFDQTKLDSIIGKKQERLRQRYLDKADKVRKVWPVVSDERTPEGASGYYDRLTNKMFVFAPDSLSATNTARHEYEHVAQEPIDYLDIYDYSSILELAQKSSDFKWANQGDFDYLQSGQERGSRFRNLKQLMQERKFNNISEAASWLKQNRKYSSEASLAEIMRGYDFKDPNFDLHQLFDLYGSDGLELLEKHYNTYNKPKASIEDRFSTGGDVQLSQDAFQVKGNPQVTDGNYYPELNAKLDHNEVVKDNFVFSDKLVNPSTGNKFSEDAKKLEKNIAKSEMKVTKFKDRIAAKTAAHQQRMSYELRETQESTATLLGHRNPDGSTKQPGQYATGGPIEDPKTIEAFQRWYNSLPGSGNKLNIDGKWGKETEQAYKNTSEQFLTDTGRNLIPGDMFRGQSTPISDQRYVDYTPKMSPEGKLLDATLESKYIPYTDKPLNTLPNRMLNLETRVPGAIDPLTGERQPDLLEATPGTSIANRLSPQLGALKAAKENAAPAVARPITRAIGGTGYQTPFTVGDAMQAVDVASKFGMLIGGPEREKVYADTTPIDEVSFDVRPQLYQSQRNLSNYMSSVDTSNINLRRSLFNQAYANKLNTDAQTLAQYQQMNNAATVDYQNRLSNRRRFNIGQRTYTDNINAANRGQYLNTVQSAFTSLGNFGQALNQKVVANDTMNIYSKIYPNTYSSVAEALAYEDYLKLRARKQDATD